MYSFDPDLFHSPTGDLLHGDVQVVVIEGVSLLGQVAQYRNGVKDTSVSYDENAINTNMTMPTTRFVQRNNVLHLSSLSIYYELPLKWARKLSLQRLRTTLYANDLYTFSSIEIERGTSYPYARSFSLSVTATF